MEKCISGCPSLHTLRIPQGVPGASVGATCFGGVKSLQTIILECKVEFGDVVKILETCEGLQRLECHKIDVCHPNRTRYWWHGIKKPNLEAILLRWGEGPEQVPVGDMYVCVTHYSFSNTFRESWD